MGNSLTIQWNYFSEKHLCIGWKYPSILYRFVAGCTCISNGFCVASEWVCVHQKQVCWVWASRTPPTHTFLPSFVAVIVWRDGLGWSQDGGRTGGVQRHRSPETVCEPTSWIQPAGLVALRLSRSPGHTSSTYPVFPLKLLERHALNFNDFLNILSLTLIKYLLNPLSLKP